MAAFKDWESYKWVKLDIHQTTVQATHAPDLGAPTPGVLAFIKKVLSMDGWGIVFSCGGFTGGAAEDKNFKDDVREWLDKNGIKSPMIKFLPDERYIIDISDRAVTFRGDWGEMWIETKSRAERLEATKTPDGPKPPPKTLAAQAKGPGAPPPLRGEKETEDN